MAENIEICRRLWIEDHVSFTGKYHSFSDVTIMPRPAQQPCPIWIAANPQPHEAEKPLRRVARIADGWMSANAFPGLFAANWEKLAAYLKEAGQDPTTYPTIAYHNININPDRIAALQESKRFLDEYYGPVFAPPMVEGWTAAGTPKQCAEDLRALARSGAKAITLRITAWDQAGQFQRLVHEVLPLVDQ
jgi:alkanesulfonate monooxygenase SsuD/methylene tetrahydromethanopterin reductase-like flavin-dependent oxidoreductase (luciferase family)